MKNYVSYVIQDAKGHTHHSEVVDLKGPQYDFSTGTQISEVFEWKENKQSELLHDQKLIITNIFKI